MTMENFLEGLDHGYRCISTWMAKSYLRSNRDLPKFLKTHVLGFKLCRNGSMSVLAIITSLSQDLSVYLVPFQK